VAIGHHLLQRVDAALLPLADFGIRGGDAFVYLPLQVRAAIREACDGLPEVPLIRPLARDVVRKEVNVWLGAPLGMQFEQDALIGRSDWEGYRLHVLRDGGCAFLASDQYQQQQQKCAWWLEIGARFLRA
jgi:hypothetical protein